jgi:glycosyltransferase involved in cell wall biosynthesis
MPSTSVVIPAFRSAFVGEAIRSALRQEPPPAEIILVDGSPETTVAQIEDCLKYVRHMVQPPGGVSRARNAGIAAAQGDYIALLDADDLWLPGKLKTQSVLLERHPEAGFCFSTTWNLLEGGDPAIPQDPYRPDELMVWEKSNRRLDGAVLGNVYELLLSVNCVATSSLVARRTALTDAGPFDESLKNGEDYDLWLRLAAKFPAIYVCEPLSRYRVHGDGLSGSWAARSELFYRANIRVLEKHFAAARDGKTRRALARALADFAGFQLKQARRAGAREAALKSLCLKPSVKAAQRWIEAVSPRLYSAAAHFARGVSP